jgi:proline dehydrogenase
MLKGIASDRLRVLQRDGWPTQVYLPYGREWFLYLCNRLAEHPPNVLRALAEAVGGQGRDN